MQDFTGLPAVVDLAAMRDAMKNMGGDPQKINPLVPVNQRLFDLELNGSPVKIGDGSIVIAAITSCTNTSNPFVQGRRHTPLRVGRQGIRCRIVTGLGGQRFQSAGS